MPGLRLIARHWGLPALLGGISVFGFAPFYLFPIPIFSLAALFFLLRKSGPGSALPASYAFGLGWFLAGVSWVYVSLHDYGAMPMPLAGLATLLAAAFLAIFPALAMWLTMSLAMRWQVTARVRWLVLAPVFWSLLEWVRDWLLTGFPWQAIGYAQAPYSPLAGYAAVLGVFGVSWLSALTAGALSLLPGAVFRHKLEMLLLVLAVWLGGYGLARIEWTHALGEPVSVSLLQGNVAQEMKFNPDKLADTLIRYRRMIQESTARLIVTPETAAPVMLDALPADYLNSLAAHARQQGGDLLLGVPERLADGRYFNSMVSLGSAPPQTYRKVHLVPFGEFLPPGFGWIVTVLKIPLSNFSRGPVVQPPFTVAGQRVAVNICYEDVFGEELIHALPEATMMANVSNDAWFGDSFAPWQHLQIAQMRALETRRWWLKANNTGITAILDQQGRVVARLAPFTTDALRGTAQGRGGATPYVRGGNYPYLTLAFLALLLAAWLGRRSRP